MAKKQRADQGDKNLGNIESALSKTELFIENNQKPLTNILLAVLAVVLLIIAGNRYILKPRNVEAAASMYMAEKFFERDSFNIALNGYGTYPGFLDVIDEYSFTKSANLAKYYAGICFKETGDFESAIDYLEKFKTRDMLVAATAMSSLGDAYCELGEYDKALKTYLKAAKKYDNSFSTPIILKKAGIVYEETGELDKALSIYKRIRDKYPDSSEGNEMNKYIGRVEAKIANS
ncbi:MAG: tetratricopeptide repeat protein [Bacteroidales bacterium]|nr:tetratricopeptide repeat protein [Bacteroidales bacterium]